MPYKRVVLPVSLPEPLYFEFKYYCDRRGTTASNLIRNMIRSLLEKERNVNIKEFSDTTTNTEPEPEPIRPTPTVPSDLSESDRKLYESLSKYSTEELRAMLPLNRGKTKDMIVRILRDRGA